MALQEKGINIQEWEAKYNAIMDQEEAGTAEPGAAVAFVNESLKSSGIQLEVPSKDDAVKAAQLDYNTKLQQFAITNPGYVIKHDPETGAAVLSAAGVDAFNKYINQTVYGSSTATGSVQGMTLGTAPTGGHLVDISRQSPEVSQKINAIDEQYAAKKTEADNNSLSPRNIKYIEDAVNRVPTSNLVAGGTKNAEVVKTAKGMASQSQAIKYLLDNATVSDTVRGELNTLLAQLNSVITDVDNWRKQQHVDLGFTDVK